MMHLPTFSKFMLYWYVGTRSWAALIDFPGSFFFFLLGKQNASQGLWEMWGQEWLPDSTVSTEGAPRKAGTSVRPGARGAVGSV